jgi:hypothetical protein
VSPDVSAKRKTPTNEMKMIQKTIFADPRKACSTEGQAVGVWMREPKNLSGRAS